MNKLKDSELNQIDIIEGLKEDVTKQHYAQKEYLDNGYSEILTMTTTEEQKIFFNKTIILVPKQEPKYRLSILNNKDFPTTIYGSDYPKLEELQDLIYNELNHYSLKDNKYIQ